MVKEEDTPAQQCFCPYCITGVPLPYTKEEIAEGYAEVPLPELVEELK